MSMTYGENFRVTIFGQSHSGGIGVVIDGIPAGKTIDMDELNAFLSRRAPGKSSVSTARKEPDLPEFLSGLIGNRTCGAPIAAIIRNTDIRPGDYADTENVPRPGHADYTAFVKYFGAEDRTGGGHFSGRLTAPLCIAGGIAKQLLEKEGVKIVSRLCSVGGVTDAGDLTESYTPGEFPTVDPESGRRMIALIEDVKASGDSIGGTVECAAFHVPAGLGDPMFSGMENRISQAVFAIPGVKAIEFGAGFRVSALHGSENNDPIRMKNGCVTFASNNSGGILGGITNGEPIVFRAAMKPTPSIAKEQESVDLVTGCDTAVAVKGRHDPCIAVRASVVVEAAAALAIYDAFLQRKQEL